MAEGTGPCGASTHVALGDLAAAEVICGELEGHNLWHCAMTTVPIISGAPQDRPVEPAREAHMTIRWK